MRNAWIWIGGAAVLGAGVVVAIASSTQSSSSPDPEPKRGRVKGRAKKPVAVGRPEDPAIAAALNVIDDKLAAAGVSNFTARELTIMRSAPGRESAIPVDDYVANLVAAAAKLQVLRDRVGFPLFVRSAYRAPDYNAAVGGAKGSTHMFGMGIDYQPAGEHNTPANRKRLALAGGRLANERGGGFAVYGTRSNPTNGHLDIGRTRTWKHGAFWREQAGAVA